MKKKLVYGVIVAIAVGTLLSIIVVNIGYEFAKIFLVFLAILVMSLLTLFIVTLADGIKKLCPGETNCVPPTDELDQANVIQIEVEETNEEENQIQEIV